MFELSDTLVGIYKVADCTQQCTIKNNTAEGQHQKNISSQRSRITQTQELPDYTLNDNFLRPSQPVRQYQKQLSIINGSLDQNDSLIDHSVNQMNLEDSMDTSGDESPVLVSVAAQIHSNEVPVVQNNVEELADAMEVSRVDSAESQRQLSFDSTMDTSIEEPSVEIIVNAQIHSNN